MSEAKSEERKLAAEQLEIARVKLRASGGTVLSPNPEWTALQKEIAALKRKLR